MISNNNNSRDNTRYHLGMFHQVVSNQVKILEWAQTGGQDEVDALIDLLPDPLIEFPGELTLTGRVQVDHWDDLDPLLTQLQHRIGSLYIESDEPELRVRVYKASGHPYFTVKLRVTVPLSSPVVQVATRISENPLWDYYWVDKKRERE